MDLFLKGFIIGIAKVIPGLSGAMLAVSFGIYDRLINSITSFFDNKKDNFKFLLLVGSGILLAIVFFSKIIRYFIGCYYIETMMLFIGLIVGGTYSYSKNIDINIRNIVIVLLVILFVMLISFGNVSSNYVMNDSFLDYIMFFIGGIVEIFSSIVPGISGTALFMLMGMYDNILMLFSNMLDLSYVFENIMLYISYGIGMMISFIVFSILISYLLKKYRKLFDTIVLGLSISSILLLLVMTFSKSFSFMSLFIGCLMFFVGVVISYLSPK
jgi:putative membrane protein